jgi:hypothetical protein
MTAPVWPVTAGSWQNLPGNRLNKKHTYSAFDENRKIV